MSTYWDPSSTSCLQLVESLCTRICPPGSSWDDGSRRRLRHKLVHQAFTILLDQAEVPYPQLEPEQRDAHNEHRMAEAYLTLQRDSLHSHAARLQELVARLPSCDVVRLKTWAGQHESEQPVAALTEHSSLLSLLLGLRGMGARPQEQQLRAADTPAWHAPLPVQQLLREGTADAVAVLRPLPLPKAKAGARQLGELTAHEGDWCDWILANGRDVFSSMSPGAGSMLASTQLLDVGVGPTDFNAGAPLLSTSMADDAAQLAAGVSQRPNAGGLLAAGMSRPPHTAHMRAPALSAAPAPAATRAGQHAGAVHALGAPASFMSLPTATLEMCALPGSWTVFDTPVPPPNTWAPEAAGQTPAGPDLEAHLPTPRWAQPNMVAVGVAPQAAPAPARPTATQPSTSLTRAAPQAAAHPAASSPLPADSTQVALLALQGLITAAEQLTSAACAERAGGRITAEARLMGCMAEAAEARIRLDEFVAAQHTIAQRGVSASGHAVLHAFVCCVESCLAAQTQMLQVLSREGAVRAAARVQAHAAGGLAGGSTCAVSITTTTPLTLLELSTRTAALRAQLQLLAAVCHCTPDADGLEGGGVGAGGDTLATSCIMPPSRWRTCGFPGGAPLLSQLYAGLLEAAGGEAAALLRTLFVAALGPFTAQLSAWLYGGDGAGGGVEVGCPPDPPTFLGGASSRELRLAGVQQRLLAQLAPKVGVLAARLSASALRCAREAAAVGQAAGEQPSPAAALGLDRLLSDMHVGSPHGTRGGVQPAPWPLAFTVSGLRQVAEVATRHSINAAAEVRHTLTLLARREAAAAAAVDLEAVARAQEGMAARDAARAAKEAAADEARAARAALAAEQRAAMDAAEQARRVAAAARIREEQEALALAALQEHAAAVAALRQEVARTRRADKASAASGLEGQLARRQWRAARLALAPARQALWEALELVEMAKLHASVAAARAAAAADMTPLPARTPATSPGPPTTARQLHLSPPASIHQDAAGPHHEDAPNPFAGVPGVPEVGAVLSYDEPVGPAVQDMVQVGGSSAGGDAGGSVQPAAGAHRRWSVPAVPFQPAGVPTVRDPAWSLGMDSGMPGQIAQQQQQQQQQHRAEAAAGHSVGADARAPAGLPSRSTSRARGLVVPQPRSTTGGPHSPLSAATSSAPQQGPATLPHQGVQRRKWAVVAPWGGEGEGEGAGGPHREGGGAPSAAHEGDGEGVRREEALLTPVSSVVEVCLVRPIRAHFALTSAAVWGLMLGELKLLHAASTLRRFLFMEAGDWAQALCDELSATWARAHRDARGNGPVQLPARALQLAVEAAAAVTCSSTAQVTPPRGTVAQRGRDVWDGPESGTSSAAHATANAYGVGSGGIADACVLVPEVVWPVSVVLLGPGGAASEAGRAVLAVYGDVASALLRLRLCAGLLHRAWLAVGKPIAAGALETGAVGVGASVRARAGSRLQAVRGWLSTAMHFVSSVQRHASGVLMGRCWAALEAGWRCGAGGGGGLDVEQMAAVHAAYLADAAGACFLHPARVAGLSSLLAAGSSSKAVRPAAEAVRGAVVAALRSCEQLAVAAGSFAEHASQAAAPQAGGGAASGTSSGKDAYAATAAAAAVFEKSAVAAYGLLHDGALATPPQGVAQGVRAGAVLDGGRLVALELHAQLDCEWYARRWAASQAARGRGQA